MANMHLVTGYAGEKHVTAADHGALYAALFGSGQYVLGKGNKLAASVIASNTVRVYDGDLVMQGRYARLNEGSYVDLAIETGTLGMKRNDLIVARYTKNESSGVEAVDLVVIKGELAESEPVDPEYTSGDLMNQHAILSDMPLYRVPIDGINVQPLVPLFDTLEVTLKSLSDTVGGWRSMWLVPYSYPTITTFDQPNDGDDVVADTWQELFFDLPDRVDFSKYRYEFEVTAYGLQRYGDDTSDLSVINAIIRFVADDGRTCKLCNLYTTSSYNETEHLSFPQISRQTIEIMQNGTEFVASEGYQKGERVSSPSVAVKSGQADYENNAYSKIKISFQTGTDAKPVETFGIRMRYRITDKKE